VREAAVVFKPETLVRWHRSGFRLYWRWKSRRHVGRPAIPADIRDLIWTISRDNQLWGVPRIHGELLKTWDRHRPVDGRQVHVTASWSSLSGLASLIPAVRVPTILLPGSP
jgi:hypothetical protein